MNILHHKSWHVRNKNNIARVRRDELKAKEEEEAKDKRRLIAESEARIDLLRSNSKQDCVTATSIADIFKPSSNIDDRKNVEHVKETKKDKEDWEKKVGILTFLGQGCNEIDKPWYLQNHTERLFPGSKDDPSSGPSNPSKYHINDPLEDMQRYLDIMKKDKPKKESPPLKSTKISEPPISIKKETKDGSSERSKSKKKSKKSKKKKHKRSKKSSSEDESSSSDESIDLAEKRAKLESLRAERLRRERIERERVNKLFNKEVKSEPKAETDRGRRYNSQFNPHLAKQNTESTTFKH